VYALTTVPEQRQVARDGFSSNETASGVLSTGGATVVGKVTCSRNFGAVLPVATTVEIHQKAPVLDELGTVGLHTWINKALQLQDVADTLTIAGVSNQYRYSLAAYPWITQEQQLIAVRGPEYVSGMDSDMLPGAGRIRIDADVPYLIIETPVTTGQSFYIDIYRPRSSWIKVGGTWGESTVGLVNETDEATADLYPTVNIAWYLFCDAKAQESPPGDAAIWMGKRSEAAKVALPYLRNQAMQAQSRLEGLAQMSNGGGDSPAYRRNLANSSMSSRRRWP
jgi:hypothetical protein